MIGMARQILGFLLFLWWFALASVKSGIEYVLDFFFFFFCCFSFLFHPQRMAPFHTVGGLHHFDEEGRGEAIVSA